MAPEILHSSYFAFISTNYVVFHVVPVGFTDKGLDFGFLGNIAITVAGLRCFALLRE